MVGDIQAEASRGKPHSVTVENYFPTEDDEQYDENEDEEESEESSEDVWMGDAIGLGNLYVEKEEYSAAYREASERSQI